MPSQGYFDIKEGLIPEMVRVGQTVAAKVLSLHATGFRDHESYLSALTHYLHSGVDINEDLSLDLIRRSIDLWTAENARLAADVTIHGPVVVMERAVIASGVVIFGPAIIEPDVTIGENSLIDNTVVWARANIASNCRIRRSIIDHNATVRPNSVVNENVVLCQNTAGFGPWTNLIGSATNRFQPHIAIPE
jgi:NDP-sugar pyrophosphorylase family protein